MIYQTKDDYNKWLKGKTGERCVKNLIRHGFDACMVQTKNEASHVVIEKLKSCQSFGFGGSATTRALNLPDTLKDLGKTVHDHWNPGPEKSDLDVRLEQGRCDCFLCSANAISMSGEIVNVDGAGNRNNAMSFGCPKVVIVAGTNKITRDLESAIRRVRDVAGPMRAKSLNRETPCAETGICTDCNSPQRICNITTILHRKPMMTDISVILINEELGY